jgi:hypothetical protein
MVTQKIKELEATKAKIVALEKSIASQLQKELASLPSRYGFDTVKAFTKAVVAALGGKKSSSKKRPAKAAGKARRRKRAVITEEMRSEVKKLVDAGKTGGEIAKAVGISLPSVQNIKKALGLVKARK